MINATDTCISCGGELRTGLTSWHRICRNCNYEKGLLTTDINAPGEPIMDQQQRESGLYEVRKRNFEQLTSLLSTLKPEGGKLLDVGCAHGWFLSAARKHFDVLGVEPDRNIYEVCRSKELTVRNGFFPTIINAQESFDVIVFNDVFEHIEDSNFILQACRQHLNDNGLLLLNLPNQKGIMYHVTKILYKLGVESMFERLWQKGLPSPHLHYFNQENLGQLLIQQKFEVVNKGTLDTLVLPGLYSRINYTGNLSVPVALLLYAIAAISIPILKILPGDIIYLVARVDAG